MYEKSKNVLSATTEVLALYINLDLRKVAEFEKEKMLIMNNFIDENKSKFKFDNLQFLNKLKK
jgi:acyl-CoA thioester hydrolase